MDEKLKFVGDVVKDEWTISELCLRYGISRKTGYKWILRYRSYGPAGLEEHSRAPDRHPNATPLAVEEAVVAFRQRHPRWGPKKLIHRLKHNQPEVRWPAASTAGLLLKRHGLAEPRKRHRRTPEYSGRWHEVRQPNDVWAADFKGWFRTRDGKRVDPLTITDMASRYLVCCQGLARPRGEEVKREFAAAFRRNGMPWAIRTDNGSPFAARGFGGLSRLSVWWIKLGIRPERIRPGHPEENGSHERFHRSLKAETADPPREDPASQQQAFDRFLREYNDERPHESLEMEVPSQRYHQSSRTYHERIDRIEYGSDFEVRRVRQDGYVKWCGSQLYLNEALSGENVGLKRTDNDMWTVYFGPVPLARYDVRSESFKDLERQKV